MSSTHFLDSNGLLYLWAKIKAAYVAKESGKSLISDTEIARLANVINYDDTEVQAALSTLEGKVEALEAGTYDDTQLRQDIANTYATITSLANHTGDTTAHLTSAEHTKLTGIAEGAQVNVIETINVNGSALTPSSKAVSITIPTNNNQLTNGAGYQTSSDVSTYVTGLGYQTSSQVSSAISSALADVTGISYEIVQSLPQTGEAGVIYLISNSGSNPNIYDEYIYVSNAFEKIGTTDVDLSGYAQYSDKITNAEIDTICV